MKKHNKILSFLLSLVVVFCAFPLSAYAAPYKVMADENYFIDYDIPNIDKSVYTFAKQNQMNMWLYYDPNSFNCFLYLTNDFIDNSGNTAHMYYSRTSHYDYLPKHINSDLGKNVKLYSCNLIADNPEWSIDDVSLGYDSYMSSYNFNVDGLILLGADLYSKVISTNTNKEQIYFWDYSTKSVSFADLTQKYYIHEDGSITTSADTGGGTGTGGGSGGSGSTDTDTDNSQNIFDKFKQVLNDIKDGVLSLPKKITDLWDNLKAKLTTLIDTIKDKFSELSKSISGFFTDLKTNLTTWFNNVKTWFSSLGDRISGFFDKLWNRIYWGNENGESEYDKPVIDNKLNDILSKLQEYQLNLKGSIDTISSASADVSTYIAKGTELVNGVVGVAGTGFTALIVFGIVFVLVRKVVGR